MPDFILVAGSYQVLVPVWFGFKRFQEILFALVSYRVLDTSIRRHGNDFAVFGSEVFEEEIRRAQGRRCQHLHRW